MKITTTAKNLDAISAEALLVIHEKSGLLGETKNKSLAAHLENFAKDASSGKTRREWFCTLPAEAGCKTKHLLLDSATFGTYTPHDEPLKIAAARCIALCREYSIRKIAIAVHHDLAADKAGAILEGILLGDFKDDRFKGKGSNRPALELQFVVRKGSEKTVSAELKRREIICEAQNHARELVNAPHHVLTPDGMAKYAKSLAKKWKLECTVYTKNQLIQQGFLPTVEVGRGSEYPPRMIILRYKPKSKSVREHLCLVGKGMTFDSGGLCIKGRTMHEMNGDMGGAAAVLGAMEAIARLKLPIRVTAVIGSAHNAVDGAAYHPGSIIKAKNGKTIYVENTDAEGRLILTDCLYKAGQEKAAIIWDFATLTGSVSNALGPAYAGLFTDDDDLRSLLMEAGQNTGDDVWPLPLAREYEHFLNHHLADLNNMSSEKRAGGIHAANFLKAFVPDGVRWAHLDIAGTARHNAKRGYLATGGSGFGVRLAVEAVRLMIERKD